MQLPTASAEGISGSGGVCARNAGMPALISGPGTSHHRGSVQEGKREASADTVRSVLRMRRHLLSPVRCRVRNVAPSGTDILL